jgi:hypothetical protein
MLYNLLVVSAGKSPSPPSWLVYRVGGRKATHLGTVKAATWTRPFAKATAVFGVEPKRLLVQQVGPHA